jgi:hypothetical protein
MTTSSSSTVQNRGQVAEAVPSAAPREATLQSMAAPMKRDAPMPQRKKLETFINIQVVVQSVIVSLTVFVTINPE